MLYWPWEICTIFGKNLHLPLDATISMFPSQE